MDHATAVYIEDFRAWTFVTIRVERKLMERERCVVEGVEEVHFNSYVRGD